LCFIFCGIGMPQKIKHNKFVDLIFILAVQGEATLKHL
jgi:hypothetical protein